MFATFYLQAEQAGLPHESYGSVAKEWFLSYDSDPNFEFGGFFGRPDSDHFFLSAISG